MKKVVFNLTDEQFARLNELASKMGISKSEALRRAIEVYRFVKEAKQDGAERRRMRTKAERDKDLKLIAETMAGPWEAETEVTHAVGGYRQGFLIMAESEELNGRRAILATRGFANIKAEKVIAEFVAAARDHWPQAEAELDEAANLLERQMQLSHYVCVAGGVHHTRTSSWHDSAVTWLDRHRPDWRDRLPRGAPAGYALSACNGGCQKPTQTHEV